MRFFFFFKGSSTNVAAVLFAGCAWDQEMAKSSRLKCKGVSLPTLLILL